MSYADADLITTILAGISIAISFPIAAAISVYVNFSDRIKSNIVAFGGGIFFATIAFSLVEESIRQGDTITLVIGFASGAILFTLANYMIKEKHSKKQKANYQTTSAEVMVVGELLDSVSEGLFIGILVALQNPGLVSAVSAIFLGNLATTIEAAKNMYQGGINRLKILRIWTYVFLAVAASAIIGYLISQYIAKEHTSVILGFAAGALLAMIAESIIPEGYEKARYTIGLSSSFGFLVGYMLFHLSF
jgi:ZIP family zinc transporter